MTDAPPSAHLYHSVMTRLVSLPSCWLWKGLASPKSAILSTPCESMSRLEALRSRCRMPLIWQYDKPRSSCFRMHLACGAVAGQGREQRWL